MDYVYLLRCADGSLYTGWTTDPDRRFAAHAAGRGAKYTKSRPPVSFAAVWQAPTRTDALRMEARIKRLSHAEKERLLGTGLPDSAFVRVR